VAPPERRALAEAAIADGLAPADRRALAEAMVADVLDALARADRLDGVVVVTAEPTVRRLAEERGFIAIHDPREAGQSAAATLGVEAALSGGAERVLLVPGDCPALDPREVDELLAGDAPAVIVPDRHGTGTNALLLTPPDRFAPAFGPGSFERHRALARAAGSEPAVASPASLLLDVDTPDDLAALRAALADHGRGAARTRAALDRLLSGSVAAAG
jgi:2-phospho-L-lactate guanylyltransferase